MQTTENQLPEQTQVYNVKIFHVANGTYCFTVRHTGPFSLLDYEKLDLEVRNARVIRRA